MLLLPAVDELDPVIPGQGCEDDGFEPAFIVGALASGMDAPTGKPARGRPSVGAAFELELVEARCTVVCLEA